MWLKIRNKTLTLPQYRSHGTDKANNYTFQILPRLLTFNFNLLRWNETWVLCWDLTSRLGCRGLCMQWEEEKWVFRWQTPLPGAESQIPWWSRWPGSLQWSLCGPPVRLSPQCWRPETLQYRESRKHNISPGNTYTCGNTGLFLHLSCWV